MRRSLALAALAILPLAACGGDDDDASGTPGDNAEDAPAPAEGAVTVVAENIQLTEDGYSAAAGEVTIVYENEDSVRHTLVIDGVDEGDFKLEVDGEGESDQGTVELEAGEFEIFCDVPGHTAMRATLTIE
jgi:plastocyanin